MNPSNNAGASRRASLNNKNEDEHPLWKYVTKYDKGERVNVGGNATWICHFCNQEKQGSYTRVRGHLLRISGKGINACPKVSRDNIIEMNKCEDEASIAIQSSQPKTVSLPTHGSSSSIQEPTSSSSVNKRKRVNDSVIGRAFDMHTRDQLDAHIGRMFFTGGLPFNLARNPYYVSAFTFAANHSLGGYIPPGYNKLRTTLLQQEKAHVQQLLEPIKSTWVEKGVSIVSDGWGDPQRRPLINFMVVSEAGPMFNRACDCSGEIKDKEFIAALMKEVIDEVGHEKVVQIVTDNAGNCKGAGAIIEGIFPHIYWTPCVVHTLNLALKNICAAKNLESNQETYEECHWITEVYGDAVHIKNYIMNHSMRLAMYNHFSPLKLLSVAETRFASVVVVLKRFKLIKRSLEAMVLSEQWIQYRDDKQGNARFVRDKVLDESWWAQVDYIIAFTAPMYDMIRTCDTNKPTLHLVCDLWDTMIHEVRTIIYRHEDKSFNEESPFFNVVHHILLDRRGKTEKVLLPSIVWHIH
ncbi:unnamed protein product [Cuscuta epithymum]|uniref:DUF659 domain-containing protein n=1 Tax=Cuscuta epithymum TaxID=186058 RepID=A0AAV0EZI7_9ASTE|nr:unnamed protein product [Cuscuta epithymum]